MGKLAESFNDHMLSCFYKEHLGVECPWCGMQRSFYYLLNGNLEESLRTFPALIPMIIMVGYLLLFLIFRFEKGPKFLLYQFYLLVGIIVTNFIFKLLN